MTAVQGTAVDIRTEDGIADAYLVHPEDGGPHPAVLLFMDAFGPRPGLRSMADRLAAAGYTVLLPNVLHRDGRAPVVELPAFIDDEARPRLFRRLAPLVLALTPDAAMGDADAFLRYLADCPAAADGPVALVGYCMGAQLALYTAGTHPDRVAAVAGFHGARLATELPDSPHLLAHRITAEVYFGQAENDSAEELERLDKALTEAGVRHRCEVYPGTQHGYTQADTSAYHEEGDRRHWAALLDLLSRTFRQLR
ncbi:dienelactone hydrolase family protein [Streptomyces sp.]|uniref:dienelactone hydrolase family protein n=1 Tax=Streptomyces sp. TaxID=1931 RepID=UPI002D278785|nr:dienelactone hydrolase family protein [Streptomyces sp.]HZF92252.1 dienelactone hydrolase family protein [Streptomyces sp.]